MVIIASKFLSAVLTSASSLGLVYIDCLFSKRGHVFQVIHVSSDFGLCSGYCKCNVEILNSITLESILAGS